jgi:hypothetical protein
LLYRVGIATKNVVYNITFVAIAHVAIASNKKFVAFDVRLLLRTFSWLRIGMSVAAMI